jgi:hypothetical protein
MKILLESIISLPTPVPASDQHPTTVCMDTDEYYIHHHHLEYDYDEHAHPHGESREEMP